MGCHKPKSFYTAKCHMNALSEEAAYRTGKKIFAISMSTKGLEYLEYTKSWKKALTTKKTNNPLKSWDMNLGEPFRDDVQTAKKCVILRNSGFALCFFFFFLVSLFKGKHFSFSKGITSVTFKNFDSSRYSSLPTEIPEFRN